MGQLPSASQAVLEKLRRTIKAAAPEAVETISYNMPTFKQNGRFLCSYAAYKEHFSLYPASSAVMDAYGTDLKPFFSGKGTLRFTADNPIPDPLLKKVVRTLIEENAKGT